MAIPSQPNVGHSATLKKAAHKQPTKNGMNSKALIAHVATFAQRFLLLRRFQILAENQKAKHVTAAVATPRSNPAIAPFRPY
jgi:hypothetical protein